MIVLASKSAARRAVLEGAGVPFEVAVAGVDEDAVREEVIHARRLYERHGWPTIDVTRRSVEETAAAVLNLLHGGHGQVEVLG